MQLDRAQRILIEERIISMASDIQLEDEKRRVFIAFDKWDDFLEVCADLTKYYQRYLDTEISVEVVRVYADFTRYFRQLKEDQELDAEIRSKAHFALDHLEYWIDAIIAAAARNWEYIHSTD
jgi:hypothetical protein